ncbi:MAG TPA: acyl-CoA dehydrogenase family protein [Gemmataceae bacterium]|nr:acyl-CoA dehydrogenase family protein [Gemmataceae bacterium]
MSQADMLENALQELAELANAADEVAAWPESSWQVLARSGALRWCIPVQYGGLGWSGVELLAHYERLASACLTTCFILSQRDAAVRRLVASRHSDLCAELLPALARAEKFTTVGLSQLTTSRQFGGPALTARLTDDGLVFNGMMPWVTGALAADYFITGAATDDGQQVLAVLPRVLDGVHVEPALPLMALQGSITAQVRCNDALVDRHWLLAGPAPQVMGSGKGGTGGLETSCLALGLAGAAIDYVHAESQKRPEYKVVGARLEQARQRLRQEMHHLAEAGATSETAATLRARANTLVLRATQTALTVSKGTGFLRTHPAQRWARQALFFLVWSCPRPTAEATLAYLTPPEGCEPGFAQ